MQTEQSKKGYSLKISFTVFSAIRVHIGMHRAERGGMLGRDRDGVIRHFEADHNGRCSVGAYDPDIQHLNRVIKDWKSRGIEFCGFVHSHPPGYCRLSAHDEWYAGKILDVFKKLEMLALPIVQTAPDTGRFQLLPFVAVPDEIDRKQCSVAVPSLEIVEKGIGSAISTCAPVATTGTAKEAPGCGSQAPATDMQGGAAPVGAHRGLEGPGTTLQKWTYFGNFPAYWNGLAVKANISRSMAPSPSPNGIRPCDLQAAAIQKRNQYLARMGKGVDLELLDNTRLVIIGTGGAASLIRNCARMGFGEIVLIDPDHVSEANVATQHAEPEAVGQMKVAALARDIVRLNPAAAVVAVAEKIEALDDRTFKLLASEPLRGKPLFGVSGILEMSAPPRQTILLVLTDNFRAQARGHRLGLHFGLPTICAQEYREGRGAEVTYTVPGVTPACHRCITASRYKAYLREGYENDVTSEGAPIFAAEMLNAVLGHVLLAVAHHGTRHQRWGKMIRSWGNRNLINIRMDPDFDSDFGDKFGKRLAGAREPESFIMLDSVFLAQTPDCGQSATRPVCPDCGGTGNLSGCKGTFGDTRWMRRGVVGAFQGPKYRPAALPVP